MQFHSVRDRDKQQHSRCGTSLHAASLRASLCLQRKPELSWQSNDSVTLFLYTQESGLDWANITHEMRCAATTRPRHAVAKLQESADFLEWLHGHAHLCVADVHRNPLLSWMSIALPKGVHPASNLVGTFISQRLPLYSVFRRRPQATLVHFKVWLEIHKMEQHILRTNDQQADAQWAAQQFAASVSK